MVFFSALPHHTGAVFSTLLHCGGVVGAGILRYMTTLQG